jgi:hypothetical protein
MVILLCCSSSLAPKVVFYQSKIKISEKSNTTEYFGRKAAACLSLRINPFGITITPQTKKLRENNIF